MNKPLVITKDNHRNANDYMMEVIRRWHRFANAGPFIRFGKFQDADKFAKNSLDWDTLVKSLPQK